MKLTMITLAEYPFFPIEIRQKIINNCRNKRESDQKSEK